MIVTVSGLSGLRNAYVSVLSAEGSSEINGASRWLDACAADGLPCVASAAMTAVEAAATRRTKASFRIVLLLLSGISTSCMSALIRSAGRTGSAARDDLDHVAVRELVLAPYALPVKAGRGSPEPGASTLLLHLVVDCSRTGHRA